jgi:hypothetical protein
VTLLMREVVAITAAVDLGVAYIGVAPLREPTERSIANDRHPDAPAMRSHFSGDGRACRDISAPRKPAGRAIIFDNRTGALWPGSRTCDLRSVFLSRSRHLAIR